MWEFVLFPATYLSVNPARRSTQLAIAMGTRAAPVGRGVLDLGRQKPSPRLPPPVVTLLLLQE